MVGGAAAPAWTSQRWMTTFDTLACSLADHCAQPAGCAGISNCLPASLLCCQRSLAGPRLALHLWVQSFSLYSQSQPRSGRVSLTGFSLRTERVLCITCVRQVCRNGLLCSCSCLKRSNETSLLAVLYSASLCCGDER